MLIVCYIINKNLNYHCNLELLYFADSQAQSVLYLPLIKAMHLLGVCLRILPISGLLVCVHVVLANIHPVAFLVL
jgi:hypothetical protein